MTPTDAVCKTYRSLSKKSHDGVISQPSLLHRLSYRKRLRKSDTDG
jgi:hypothetical protein